MALPVNPKSFIKLYRKFMNWEWYTDINTKTLFIHCLLKANWQTGEWKGIHFEAGEFITSLPQICEETGLSMRQARTALSRLETTGELTSRTTDKTTGRKLTKCRIIAVKNWSIYQGETDKTTGKSTGKTTAKRQANDTQSDSSIRNIKNNKKVKKKDIRAHAREASSKQEEFPVSEYGFDPSEEMTPEQLEIYFEWEKEHHGAV